MKITSISYKKIFPIQQYVNETIGIEIQVDDGDDEDIVFNAAKEKVEEWHQALRPFPEPTEYYKSAMTGIKPIDKPHTDEIPVIQVKSYGDMGDSDWGHGIAGCKSIEQLAKLKKELPSHWMPHYMQRMRELTPKTVEI